MFLSTGVALRRAFSISTNYLASFNINKPLSAMRCTAKIIHIKSLFRRFGQGPECSNTAGPFF